MYFACFIFDFHLKFADLHPFMHKRYLEHVVIFCAVTKQKTVFFKYKNLGRFENQGFLSRRWQIIFLVTLWNFSCVWRESLSLKRFWSDLLKSFWHFYNVSLVSYSNMKICRELKSHSLTLCLGTWDCSAILRTAAEITAKWLQSTVSLKMMSQSFLPVNSMLLSNVGKPSFHNCYSMYAIAAAFHKALKTLGIYWNVFTLLEECGRFNLTIQDLFCSRQKTTTLK